MSKQKILTDRQNRDWGWRLSKLLKEKKVTYRTAARFAGVSPSVIDSWTSGASPNDLLAVKRLCDHLGVSFSWILTGTYESPTSPPLVSEVFEEVQVFDGFARIRIDKLLPRNA